MTTDVTTLLNNSTTSRATTAANTAAKNTGKTGSEKDAGSLVGTSDQFLTILLAQLKHQDPLEPMKGTEFIDSISRLTGVEQTIKTNKHLEEMVSLLGGDKSQLGSPVAYLDKTVNFNSSQFALKNGASEFTYNYGLEAPPSDAQVFIKNAAGNVVANIPGSEKGGDNVVKWDGTDSDGNQLADGLYTVVVQYPDPKDREQLISVPTATTGKVTGADFTGVEPALNIGGIKIPLTAIRTITSGV